MLQKGGWVGLKPELWITISVIISTGPLPAILLLLSLTLLLLILLFLLLL